MGVFINPHITWSLLCFTLLLGDLQAQISSLKEGDQFPLQEINGINGELYSLADIKDKVLVLNFWNMGCKGCELERPYLNELTSRYSDLEVVFWSVTINTEKSIEQFLASHPITWEFIGGVDFFGITGDSTFLINCMPTTMIIDRNRMIKYFKCGPILEGQSGEEFTAVLQQAIGTE